MAALALMAVGTHAMALTSPALAEQAKQKEAAAERSIVRHAPAAATDGVPVPILVGGVVLAFAVGVSGGVVHRRRRVARRASLPAVAAPPVREVSPPPQPAPPPPEPETRAPRVVKPPVAPVPPPPEPPSPPARPSQPLRLVPREEAPPVERPRAAPAADAPLGEAPELPRRPEAVAVASVMPPLSEAPEALRVPESPEAPEPELPPAGPARRFARVTQWPDEAAELWTCEIDWKAGYRKANFRAMVAAPGDAKRHAFAESAPVRWALMGEPEPPTPELAVRVRALVEALEEAGWDHIGRGLRWYEQRFVWGGEGEPHPIAVRTETA